MIYISIHLDIYLYILFNHIHICFSLLGITPIYGTRRIYNISVYLSIFMSTYISSLYILSIYLSTYISYLSIYLPRDGTHLLDHQDYTDLDIYISIHLYVYLYIYLYILSIYQYILSIYLYILPIYLST